MLLGATGLVLSKIFILNTIGDTYITEDNIVISLKGAPGIRLSFDAIILTPLGVELLSLIPLRDARNAAKKVASAVKSEQIQSANILVFSPDKKQVVALEKLWE